MYIQFIVTLDYRALILGYREFVLSYNLLKLDFTSVFFISRYTVFFFTFLSFFIQNGLYPLIKSSVRFEAPIYPKINRYSPFSKVLLFYL